MKASIILPLILAFVAGYAQEPIILSSRSQQVPEGKVWMLKADQETVIELADKALRDGTYCNAQIRSRPGIVGAILFGVDDNNAYTHFILIKEMKKVNYTNQFTYSIKINSFIRLITLIRLSEEFKTKSQEDIGDKELIIHSGEKVLLPSSGCITSLQVFEFDEKQIMARE
jgi:hypothetical protein